MSASPDWRGQWLSPSEISSQYSRCVRVVQRWCNDGTLTAFGFHLFRDRTGKWWIRERIRDSKF